MLQLFYSPGACSLAAHITLEELALPYELIKVDLKTHLTAEKKDYYQINPQGAVPALLLENKELITQNSAILLYLGDLDSKQQLVPKVGDFLRIRCYEWLALLSSDLHKAFTPLFVPAYFADSETAKQELKQHAEKTLTKVVDYIEKKLPKQGYVLGEHFSVVDAMLLVFYRWIKYFKFSTTVWPHYTALFERIRQRPAVQRAMSQEGLT